MKASQQTIQQLERAIKKIAAKYPAGAEPVLTDIHLLVDQESGEVRAYNDEDEEINRCVVEQWIGNNDDDFFDSISSTLRRCLEKKHEVVEELSILQPFSFTLEDEDKEPIAELYLVDTDTVIIDPDMMQDLDEDLNEFIERLLKE